MTMTNNTTALDNYNRRGPMDLAQRLNSPYLLLDAIYDIMAITSRSEDCQLQRNGRKIIALTEVARSTLNRMGVKLHLFVVCSETLLPYKKAYFKLLLVIKSRKRAFPSDTMMDERITRLLLPLHTNFDIRFGGVDPRAQLGIEELLVPQARQHVKSAAALSSARKPYAEIDDMQSPDAFMEKRQRINEMGEFVKLQAATNFIRTGVAPKYPAADPGYIEAKSLVPNLLVLPQYPAVNPEAQPLVPEQGPADDNGQPPRPRRPFTRTNASYFDLVETANGKELVPRPWNVD
ncbi:hypothetical protein DEU56DRAFT_401433 [Suillus clintonianus]|uniref:uncharacterized protein n=1 Tax=Suillus clintonianus TaxID=1904413 RepID=UPI001B8770AB|nr:uncharacterized protein DEU56DRAFT_401433 [Suillus clintonianus]KAG2135169.1 hypothetical protein DEU56DRAFT_401433 [Suillus clintonianus]